MYHCMSGRHVSNGRSVRPMLRKPPQGHQRGAYLPEVSLQRGPAGEQGLHKVDRLPQHSRPLPQRQHLPGVPMARPGRERPVVGDLA